MFLMRSFLPRVALHVLDEELLSIVTVHARDPLEPLVLLIDESGELLSALADLNLGLLHVLRQLVEFLFLLVQELDLPVEVLLTLLHGPLELVELAPRRLRVLFELRLGLVPLILGLEHGGLLLGLAFPLSLPDNFLGQFLGADDLAAVDQPPREPAREEDSNADEEHYD
jgi:hypothetical protein